MTRRIKTQIAIRLVKGLGGGYNYKTTTADGEGTRIPGVMRPIRDVEEAKSLLGMYQSQYCPTIVTREVLIEEGDWKELQSDVKILAELLHTKQCHVSHVDQCDWTYSKNTETHKRYEKKAETILEKTTLKAAQELIELM